MGTAAGRTCGFSGVGALWLGGGVGGGCCGVVFSWKQGEGLGLRVAAGDDVGDGAAGCKPVA